jgi:hypothetical protein
MTSLSSINELSDDTDRSKDIMMVSTLRTIPQKVAPNARPSLVCTDPFVAVVVASSNMQCSPATLAAKGQLFAALIINVGVHSSTGTYLPSHCHTAQHAT